MRSFQSNGSFLLSAILASTLAACGGANNLLGGGPTAGAMLRAGGATSSERVLYSFTGGNDGGNAATGLIQDAAGKLYGTTVAGGTYACGTVFELAPKGALRWRERVLYNFTCYGDGKNPHGGVTFSPRGYLDGTTVAGGSGGACTGDGCGVVFAVTPTGENVLHSFTGGNDGFGPGSPVVFDAAGNLYGTAPDGGVNSDGVVYEVSSGGRERVLHSFTGGVDGGTGSLGPLLLKSGTLYGVTETGGAHNAGTVYALSSQAKNAKLKTLYAFKGSPDAGSPYGGLVADASGNLYGTTYYGGTKGLGAVFVLTRGPRGKYRERVLYSFVGGNDGSSSTSTLLLSNAGDLYGTTSAGGSSCDCGTIFSVNSSSGKEMVLHRFGAVRDGSYPYYGLTQDSNGNFYGTTVAGGHFNQGTVFEFSP